MKKIKIFLALLLAGFILIIIPNDSHASEGTTQIRSVTEEDYRCFAYSQLNQNNVYKVLVNCRDLIYPADSDRIYTYIVWAVPVEGDEHIKLGDLGFGKAEFTTRQRFNILYATTETDPKTNSPTGQIVMQGRVQTIEFLDRFTSPTPTPEGQEGEQPEEEIQITPTEEQSTRERLITGLRRAGFVSLLALLAVIGLVFVITRSRG